jgi:hypothetical protein
MKASGIRKPPIPRRENAAGPKAHRRGTLRVGAQGVRVHVDDRRWLLLLLRGAGYR